MSALLEFALAQLASPGRDAGRRAAWLARSALEDAVVELLRVKGVHTGLRASGRSKLSCLEALYRDPEPDVAASAEYAWARLSEACHQHAFELSPTYVEIRHLVRVVATLEDAVARGSGA